MRDRCMNDASLLHPEIGNILWQLNARLALPGGPSTYQLSTTDLITSGQGMQEVPVQEWDDVMLY